jgi:hypothetical protein
MAFVADSAHVALQEQNKQYRSRNDYTLRCSFVTSKYTNNIRYIFTLFCSASANFGLTKEHQ